MKKRPTSKPIKVRKGEKVAVVLLSGGNPQIAKADGDAPVQAYIGAMQGRVKSELFAAVKLHDCHGGPGRAIVLY